ncbi:hypothetical protein BT69DRAFT_1344343 [Atractiella rhizophila]|nr:hypothetical protein BT69DRAFT_1344343 [Atractiella rhizophila]
MHNVCEGLFANYFRQKWGIGELRPSQGEESSLDNPATLRTEGNRQDFEGVLDDNKLDYEFAEDENNILDELASIVDEAVELAAIATSTKRRLEHYRMGGVRIPQESEATDTSENENDKDWIEGASDHESIADSEEERWH